MNGLGAPDYVVHVCKVLRGAGYEAYVVGGGVRDALRGRVPKDWDVATDAAPETVLQLFPRTVPTGVKFGTVSVLVQAPEKDGYIEVEVTTFRGESGYADGRRPDEVHFLGRIEDDLVRRDFTVNAIAYDPGTGEIVDPYFGRRDLERRVLRAVGDPDARFREDGLRVLRAVRLATELDFTIHPLTGDGLRRNAAALEHVSRERIGEEWRRIMSSPAAGRGLLLLYEYELLPYVLPGGHAAERVEGAAGVLSRMYATASAAAASVEERLVAATATTLYCLGSPGVHRRWLLDLVYPKRLIRSVLAVAEVVDVLREAPELNDGALRRTLGKLGRTLIPVAALAWRGVQPADGSAVSAERIEAVAASGAPICTAELALNGHDVQRLLGVRGGAAIGETLDRLLEHVLARPEDNTRERLTRLVEQWHGDG